MGVTKHRIFILAGIVVATIPLLGASCSVHQAFTNSGLPKIQFVGDSITVLSAPDINAHYGLAYDVAVDAYTGATTYEVQSAVAADAANRPAVVVIDLGTNDASAIINGRSVQQGSDPPEPVSAVEARLDQFAADFAASLRGVRHDQLSGLRLVRQ